MAKRSMIEREKKRTRAREKYGAKRDALRAIIADRNVSDEERWDAQLKLQAQPRQCKPSASPATLRPDRTATRCI